ncbi:MAG: lipoyl(octanoyl) transferase LipB [Gammaproteobacteria bacterium]|nr:lipoyl(octanoyl) transferase LipB [Gammaproteobacteria bacterium]
MTRLLVRQLGCGTAYEDVFRAMRAFTDRREESTTDELWLTEHAPVFTQGQAGRAEYLLAPGDIPVVQTDRGGQVTYHGPGQIVGYLMFDLRRLGLSVRSLVRNIEAGVVALLGDYGIDAAPRSDAPGVYVGRHKIAALGLRVRRGYSYHGLSLNVDMDLSPYARIVPCGLKGTGVTSMALLTHGCSVADVTPRLVGKLVAQYGFDQVDHVEGPHAAAP